MASSAFSSSARPLQVAHRVRLPSDWPVDQSLTERFGSGTIFFVGNATVLLRYAGFTILTDPNFLHKGDHVHLGYGIHTERLTNPALELDELPPIDFIVLSHMHEDHFDRLVNEKLNRQMPIISDHYAVERLQAKGFVHAFALETWQSAVITKGDSQAVITSMPGRHAPTPLAQLHVLPTVMGSMLEFFHTNGHSASGVEGMPSTVAPTAARSEPLLRLYISGDTLMYDGLKEIPQRYPDIDLALMHLGGTTVLGIYVTMDSKQGIQLTKLVNAKITLPIHYNDYKAFKSPIEDYMAEVAAAGLEDRVVLLKHGDTYRFVCSRFTAPPASTSDHTTMAHAAPLSGPAVISEIP